MTISFVNVERRKSRRGLLALIATLGRPARLSGLRGGAAADRTGRDSENAISRLRDAASRGGYDGGLVGNGIGVYPDAVYDQAWGVSVSG
jgi:hypothetical protein